MTGLRDLRRLERGMIYVRWFGVAFAATGVAIQPSYPNTATRTAAWVITGALAAGNLAIWGAIARITTDRDWSRLGIAAFVFDIAIVMAMVSLYAYETPYVTWALLFILPLEGALRYRMRGALAAAGLNALFFVVQSIRVADIQGTGFDFPTYVFVVCVSTLIGAVAGTMAEGWHKQSVALEEQGERLAKLDQLKDRFLATTSHELRGPLTAIIGGVDTIILRADRITPEQHDRMIEMISKQSHQLARLVEDLLVTSQAQSHKLSLRVESSSLEGTVGQALEAAEANRRGHQLELYVEPVDCEIDPARVSQIARNLVENAYKYSPERTRVSVDARTTHDGISLSVSDHGPGIPEAKRDELFEAFSRIEETAAGRDGVGLGLYVVSELVEAMDGRIDLVSSPKGTRFTIHIPCTVRRNGAPLGLVPDRDEPTPLRKQG
ncbi:MAG TPA: ATP-binding protein [Actinomycetota bacterium]|jgi:signal transduction histidine kinase